MTAMPRPGPVAVALLLAGLLALAGASWLLVGGALAGRALPLLAAFGFAFGLLCAGAIAWAHVGDTAGSP